MGCVRLVTSNESDQRKNPADGSSEGILASACVAVSFTVISSFNFFWIHSVFVLCSGVIFVLVNLFGYCGNVMLLCKCHKIFFGELLCQRLKQPVFQRLCPPSPRFWQTA
jgi:hypothetical protein